MKQQTKFKETEIGMIPEDWEVATLADHIEIIGGGTPKTTVDEYWNGDIPWISVTDFVGDKRRIYNTEKHITKEGLENSSTKLLHKGQIIISARGTVGELGQVTRDMAFNQSCYGIGGKKDLDNDYLYYLLKQKVKEFQQKGHGAVFNTITKETFNQIVIPMPELSEQSAIAKILSSLDEKIELNQQMNKTLETMGQAIFKRWFVDFEFPNEKSKPYKSSGGEMIDSELGEIPKGWKVEKLESELEFIRGIEPGRSCYNKEKKGKKFIRVGNLTGKRNEELYVDIKTDSYCSKNEILISFDGTIGIVKIGCEGIFSSGIRKAIWKSKLYGNFFVYLLMISDSVQQQIQSFTGDETTIKHVGKNIDKLKFIIPFEDKEKILNKFNQITSPIFNRLLKNLSEIETLSQIRDSLLPKLMSGKIRVLVGEV